MPITARPDVLFNRSNMSLPADQPDYTVLDMAADAFRSENSLASLINSERGRPRDTVEGYNPFDELEGVYLDYAEHFTEVTSPAETAYLKAKIDEQLQRRQRLASGGLSGLGYMAVATLLDPIEIAAMAIPGGQAKAGGNVARFVAEAAAVTALSETALRSTQETRTISESAVNITGAALMTGVLGRSLVALDKKRADKLAEAVHREINGGFDSAGSAKVGGTTLEQETEVSAFGLEKLAITAFGRLAKSASVTARSVAQGIAESNRLFRKNQEGVASEISLETLKKRETGVLAQNLFSHHSEFKDYRKAGGKLKKTEFNEAVSMALRRGDVADDPLIQAAAQRWRGFFDKYKKQAQDAGLLPDDVKVKTADSYLTRVYRTDVIRANRLEWDELVTDWVSRSSKDIDPIDASGIADEITRNIMGHPQGLIPRDVVPKAGPLKERVFDIDDALIEKFLENDVTRVAEIYQRSMVPEILLTQRFGSRDLSDQIARVADEYSVAREAARDNPKKLDKLQREEQKALRDIEAMRDMLLETYARPADPSSFFVKASRAMRTFNYIRMLGGMTISAIPDLARPVMQQGLLRTAKFMMKAALTPKRVRMSMLDARRFGVGVDMVLNTRAAAIADVGEDMGQKMDRYLNRGSQQFSVLSLMAPWNATMKQLSGVMIADSMLADIGRLASGNIAKKRAQKLANSGIDSRMASRIAKQFEKHGDDGTLRLGQSDKWDDIEARQAYESAVLKEVENVIITPGIADKPNFMSSEVGKTLMQFKSFAFASANRIAISGLQQRDMAQLNGLMLSVFLGGVVYATKQYASGRPITDNPTTFLNNAIDRSGVTGYLWDIKNVYEKMSGNVLFGDQQVSRYQSRNAVGALLGPSLGTAEDLQGVFRAMHEEQPNRSDVRAARRLVPYQNLFYTQKLFDALEESAAQAVDAQ